LVVGSWLVVMVDSWFMVGSLWLVEHPTTNQQQTTNNKQQTTNNKQQTTTNQQPTIPNTR
jgi:hypothetical protein